MTHLPLLRLSLLSLVLVLPGLAAAPPATAPAASADPKQAEAEKQEKAEAEKQKAAAEKQKRVDSEKQKQTVADIRRIGTALFSWLTDQVEAAVAEQEAEKQAKKQTENGTRGEEPPRGNAEDTRQNTLDIQDYPLVSREDLEELLVPQYIAALPETDAWGNPYEVRINTDNLMAKTVITIRSPGRKGYYAGDVYKIESFDPAEVDQDIVWADGYFVRWPQAATPAGKPLPIPPSGQR
jgi:hypothetical protein